MDGNDKNKNRRADKAPTKPISAGAEDDTELENEGDEDEAESNLPPGLHGEEELDEIYSQRGGEEFSEGEEPEVKEAKTERPAPQRRRGQFRDARDVLLGEARDRLARVNDRLKTQLSGSIIIEVSDPKSSFMMCSAESGLSFEELADKAAATSDCKVMIRQSDLLRVANGDLNPQVGMLSDRIKVEGRVGLAVYLFNLIAPQQM